MTQPDSGVSELLAALRVGDGVDLVRELARWALQELIELDATAAVGVAPDTRPRELDAAYCVAGGAAQDPVCVCR